MKEKLQYGVLYVGMDKDSESSDLSFEWSKQLLGGGAGGKRAERVRQKITRKAFPLYLIYLLYLSTLLLFYFIHEAGTGTYSSFVYRINLLLASFVDRINEEGSLRNPAAEPRKFRASHSYQKIEMSKRGFRRKGASQGSSAGGCGR